MSYWKSDAFQRSYAARAYNWLQKYRSSNKQKTDAFYQKYKDAGYNIDAPLGYPQEFFGRGSYKYRRSLGGIRKLLKHRNYSQFRNYRQFGRRRYNRYKPRIRRTKFRRRGYRSRRPYNPRASDFEGRQIQPFEHWFAYGRKRKGQNIDARQGWIYTRGQLYAHPFHRVSRIARPGGKYYRPGKYTQVWKIAKHEDWHRAADTFTHQH